MTSDRGDIVIGWLSKVVLVLAVLGVIAFDLASLGIAQVQAEDHAQAAARVASSAYGGPADLQRAYEAALAEVVEHGDTIETSNFAISQDGTVTLTVRRTAPTIVVEKVPPLRFLTDVSRTVTARRAL